jgi:hypothetical protein
MEQEKLPFSLVDSEFALWSPDPNQWRLRLRARPTRTDSSVSDTGTMELEATLGRGDSLAHIPLNLQGQWRDAPLGEASRVIAGHDAGWRGNMALSANIRGTLGESAITARLHLIGARRADFVPQQPLAAEVECFATATSIFHSFQDLRCSWPPDGASGASTVAMTGEIPDIRRLEESKIQLGTSGVPASTLLGWLRVLTPGISDDLSATGKLIGSLSYNEAATHQWTGRLTLHDADVRARTDDSSDSLIKGDISLRTGADVTPDAHRHQVKNSSPLEEFTLSSTTLALGGHDPAAMDGHFDRSGYVLHLTGTATTERLKELATALPCVAGGLADVASTSHEGSDPFHVDLTSAYSWTEQLPRTWQDSSSHQTVATAKSRRQR